MLFTVVILSTYEFPQESLVNVKLAHSFFMPKNSGALNTDTFKVITLKVKRIKDNKLLNFRIFFLLKELFFTSPQLKITLFKPVLLQLTLMHFIDKILGNKKSHLTKRESNVSTY
jgi:hypothetical protein